MRPKPTTDVPNPTGFCECGCGQPAPISSYTSRPCGYVAGQPRRFINGHNRRKSGVEYVVDPDTGCWIWQRSTVHNGYGTAWDPKQRRVRPAHCLAYEAVHGPIPEGMEVDHRCPKGPNRRCVNPDHLEAVTPAVNVRRSRLAKLTEEDAAYIRAHVGLKSQTQMARELGVTVTCVCNVVHGRTWRV